MADQSPGTRAALALARKAVRLAGSEPPDKTRWMPGVARQVHARGGLVKHALRIIKIKEK